MKLSTLFKVALWLLLFAFTAFNAHQSIKKYLEGKISLNTRRERSSSLEFPSVSICTMFSTPGENLKYIAGEHVRNGRGQEVLSLEDIQNITFDVRAIQTSGSNESCNQQKRRSLVLLAWCISGACTNQVFEATTVV